MAAAFAALVALPASRSGASSTSSPRGCRSGGSLVHPALGVRACGEPIAWYDNVPLVSLRSLLRGRCRTCATPIGLRYPAVELATAVLARRLRARLRPRRCDALAAGVFCAALVVVTATDLDAPHRPEPRRAAGRRGRARRSRLRRPPEPRVGARRARRGGASCFVAALAYPGGMGMGDVKLALLMGVALGRTVPVALLARDVRRARAVGRPLRPARRRGARKMAIPFAPFLALGAWSRLFAGDAARPRLSRAILG